MGTRGAAPASRAPGTLELIPDHALLVDSRVNSLHRASDESGGLGYVISAAHVEADCKRIGS
jgi:hypothetical protein